MSLADLILAIIVGIAFIATALGVFVPFIDTDKLNNELEDEISESDEEDS